MELSRPFCATQASSTTITQRATTNTITSHTQHQLQAPSPLHRSCPLPLLPPKPPHPTNSTPTPAHRSNPTAPPPLTSTTTAAADAATALAVLLLQLVLVMLLVVLLVVIGDHPKIVFVEEPVAH